MLQTLQQSPLELELVRTSANNTSWLSKWKFIGDLGDSMCLISHLIYQRQLTHSLWKSDHVDKLSSRFSESKNMSFRFCSHMNEKKTKFIFIRCDLNVKLKKSPHFLLCSFDRIFHVERWNTILLAKYLRRWFDELNIVNHLCNFSVNYS